MKRIATILIFLISFVFSYGQHIVLRSNGSQTVVDSNLFIGNSFRPPIFADTTAANNRRPSLDSSGKLIYTFDANAYWYRSNSPRRWVQITGTIVNIFNNSITNITFISQVDSSITIEICTGADACDTITFTTNISNPDSTSVHFIDSTHFAICGVDTIGGTPIIQCDTVEIPVQQLYNFQNWLRQVNAGVVEFGSNQAATSPGLFLGHNTFTNTGNFRFFQGGYPVYNYPINFFQDQSFMNGSGIVSFKGNGQSVFGSAPNVVKLGVNFWGDTVNNTPTVIPGYFTDATRRFGYGIGTNIGANGSYGMNQDDSVSKNGGIFFHTTDVTNDEGVSIYAAPSVGGQYVSNLSGYFNAHFRTNGDVRWPFYPYSRGNGYAGKFLTTDSAGNMQLRTIPSSDSCGLFSGGIVTWDSLLTFDVSVAQYALCCDNVFRVTSFDTVQLAEPDTGFLRYDAIAVGVNGVEVVQGVESTDPEQPQLDSCQTLLTYVLVFGPHDDTVAASQNICHNSIYDENYLDEYTVTSTGPTIDTANTVSVAHLTKSLNVGSWTNNQTFRFTYPSTVDLSSSFALKFYISLKAVLATNTRIKLDWLNGNTLVTTATVNLGGNGTQFGFSRSVLGYQTVTIPMTAWTFTSQTVTTLRVTFQNAGSGFYMDWVQLQGCNVSPPPTPNNISFASGNLAPLFSTSVANPTSNITQSFTQLTAPAYTVFGNPTNVAAVRQDFTINLSTPSTIGLLDVERIAPCGEGYFIATVDGVQTCVPNPVTEIVQIKVMPPLFIDTTDNDTYDTLSIHLIAGTNITLDSTADGTTINASGQKFGYPGEDHLGAEDRYFVNPANNIFIQSGDSNYVTTEAEVGVNTDQVFMFAQKTSAIQGAFSIGPNGIDLGSGTFGISMNVVKDDSTAQISMGHPGPVIDNYGVIRFQADGGMYITNVLDSAEFVGTAVKGLGVTSDGRVVITNGTETLQQVFNTEVGGSVLSKSDTIITAANTLNIIGNTIGSGNSILSLSSSSSDDLIGIQINLPNATTASVGVYANTINGTAILGLSQGGGSGNGVVGYADGSGFPIGASGLTVSNVVKAGIQVFTSNGADDSGGGLGGSIEYYIGTNPAQSARLSNQLISKWIVGAEASQTSQFKLTGVLAAVTVDLQTWNADGSWQIRPITATAASAITPAEGMMLFVSNTNGTFTSIGMWDYENGAWHKM